VLCAVLLGRLSLAGEIDLAEVEESLVTWAHDRYVAAWLREVDAARHPIAFATWVEVSLRRDLLAPSSVRWSDGTLREVVASVVAQVRAAA
jgi:hypothetical protein